MLERVNARTLLFALMTSMLIAFVCAVLTVITQLISLRAQITHIQIKQLLFMYSISK